MQQLSVLIFNQSLLIALFIYYCVGKKIRSVFQHSYSSFFQLYINPFHRVCSTSPPKKICRGGNHYFTTPIFPPGSIIPPFYSCQNSLSRQDSLFRHSFYALGPRGKRTCKLFMVTSSLHNVHSLTPTWNAKLVKPIIVKKVLL